MQKSSISFFFSGCPVSVFVVVPVGVPSGAVVVVVLVVVEPVPVFVVVVVVVDFDPSAFVAVVVVVVFPGVLSPHGTQIVVPLTVPAHWPVGQRVGGSGSAVEAVCSPPVQISEVDDPMPAETCTPFLMY